MTVEEAVKFPFQDKNWFVKIFVGGILNVFPIVNFFSCGYYLEVIKSSIAGQPELPPWENWGQKFITGFIASIIGFFYLLIPFSLLFLGGREIISNPHVEPASPDLAIADSLILAGMLTALVIGFVVPMALAMYSEDGDFGAAFGIKKLLANINAVFSDYFVAYIVILGMSFLIGLLSRTPLIGWLIALFGYFYVMVVSAALFGSIYGKLRGNR